MTAKIKAITLHQPWASLIALGAKRLETRSWNPKWRGTLVIHAGKELSVDTTDRVFISLLRDAGITDVYKLPLGAAVAVCELRAVYRTEEVIDRLSAHERAFGNYQPGRSAWHLVNVRPLLPPIVVRGQQGLWDWTLPLPELAGWNDE